MDGEKMDTCVWQKIKIDAALRIMRHTQKFNSMYINWRKKKKERKKNDPSLIFDFRSSEVESLGVFKRNCEKYLLKSRNLEPVNRYLVIFIFPIRAYY